MSAADLDSNAWYIVTSQRYVNVSQPIDSCLQLTRDGPRVSSCDEKRFMAWQFEPVESKKGRYVMRMNATSVRQQLSVCWDSDETDDGKTVGCMRRTNAEDPQLWDIVDRGDGTYDFLNAANGTGRVLDVHQGSNLFMASKVEGTGDNNSSSSAQRWIMTSDRPVNNRVYSTVYQSEVSCDPSRSFRQWVMKDLANSCSQLSSRRYLGFPRALTALSVPTEIFREPVSRQARQPASVSGLLSAASL